MEASMGYINSKYPGPVLAGILLSAALLIGCAGQKTAQKDPFFDKWTTMSDTAAGHSPAPREKSSTMTRELLKATGETGEGLTVIPIKELPTQPISLTFRQANIQTILRSLARIVGKNILVKSDIKGEMTIDFREVPWNQAFNSILRTQGLTYTWEGDILRVLTFEDLELDLKRKTQEMGIKWVEPLLTVVVPIDYAKPKDLKENLETFLTRSKEDKPRGSIRVDEHSNSLIISAIKDDLARMMPIIEKIDKPTPQIQIKANIVETSKDTARNLGIQWGGMYGRQVGNNSLYITPGGTTGSTTPPGSALSGGYTPTTGAKGISGQGFGVNFPVAATAMTGGAASLGLVFGSIGGNLLDLQLTALQNDRKLNILSSPSITTLDNQKAFTENGQRVPYSTLDTTVNPPIRTVKFEDVVLRLEITPHVIDGQNLLMKILVKKDEVDSLNNVDGNPFIIKKQTETTLIVRDGETIVISGLTKQLGTRSVSGVPGLKDIPVLGWLFKGEDKSDEMEEVLIFITPRILPTLSMVETKDGATAPAGAAP
jgi:type IV pilus assembly protein PilQ